MGVMAGLPGGVGRTTGMSSEESSALDVLPLYERLRRGELPLFPGLEAAEAKAGFGGDRGQSTPEWMGGVSGPELWVLDEM